MKETDEGKNVESEIELHEDQTNPSGKTPKHRKSSNFMRFSPVSHGFHTLKLIVG